MLPSEKFEGNTINKEREEAIAGRLSSYEKTIYVLLFLMLTMILTVAAWSGILLLFGKIEGGGPLGLFVEEILVNLLLSRWL